jgi:hypothetical protein
MPRKKKQSTLKGWVKLKEDKKEEESPKDEEKEKEKDEAETKGIITNPASLISTLLIYNLQ